MMTKNELYLELKDSELNRVAMKFRKVFSNLMVLLFILTLLAVFIVAFQINSGMLLLAAIVICFNPMGVVMICEKDIKEWYVKKRVDKISSSKIDDAIKQSIAREITTLPKQIAEVQQNLPEMIKELEDNIQKLNDRYILVQELAKS